MSAQPNKAFRVLYRTLLRTAKVFDANPAYKALLFLPDFHKPFIETKESVDMTKDKSSDMEVCSEYIAGFVQARPYMPQDGSLFGYMQRIFRNKELASYYSNEELLQAAITGQSSLLRTANLVKALSGLPQFQLRPLAEPLERLTASPEISNGTLMLEHPSIGAPHPGRSAIIVYDMDQHNMEADGDDKFQVRGFVVNRPYPFQAKEVCEQDLGCLGDLQLWFGGVADSNLYILHRFPSVKDATEISHGLCIGGRLDELQQLLQTGEAEPSDFKVIRGCSTWESEGPGKAPIGMENFIYANGPGANQIALMPSVAVDDADGEDQVATAQAEDEKQGGYEHSKFLHQNTVWSAAVCSLGGEFEAFSTLHPVVTDALLQISANPNEYEIKSDTHQ